MTAQGDGAARLARDLGRRMERVVGRADDIVGLLRAAGGELRRAVPFAFDACWFTIDPSTLLVTGHYNAHLDGDADLRRIVNLGLAVNEYQEDDVNKFADLATRRLPTATLHQATGGDLERSARYRTLLRPLGAEAELRVAIREGRSCWAGVALYRPPGEPDFSEAETDLVLSVAHSIARGVRQALLLSDLDAADPANTPGLVLLGLGDGQLFGVGPSCFGGATAHGPLEAAGLGHGTSLLNASVVPQPRDAEQACVDPNREGRFPFAVRGPARAASRWLGGWSSAVPRLFRPGAGVSTCPFGSGSCQCGTSRDADGGFNDAAGRHGESSVRWWRSR